MIQKIFFILVGILLIITFGDLIIKIIRSK